MSISESTAENVAEAFGNLSDPDRMKILSALLGNLYDGVGYTELMETAGFEKSSRFDYHLSQLTDHFIRKEDGRYRLRPTGRKVIKMAKLGNFTAHPNTEPVTIDKYCQDCQVNIEAWYQDGDLYAVCPECGQRPNRSPFPPRVIEEHDFDQFLDAYSAHTRCTFGMIVRGICPGCGGPIECTIDREHRFDRLDYPVSADCDCGTEWYGPIGRYMLNLPPVTSFLWRHDIDPWPKRWWHFDWTYDESYLTLQETDPLRIQLDIELDDARLELLLSKSLEILETREV